MSLRIARSILALPGLGVVVIPALLLIAFRGSPVAARPAGVAQVRFWLAALVGCAGLGLIVWTIGLFARHGKGTLAPWDPPTQLVVRGPYRHVRNPMIIGAQLLLVCEALALGSWPIAVWAALFFLGNALYFPLIEERRLEARFSEDYLVYKANVRRWVPSLPAWDPLEEEAN